MYFISQAPQRSQEANIMYDCLGSVTPPTICGYNTGQHMYVDSSSQCNKLTFLLDLSTSSTRNWQIKVTLGVFG